MTAILETVGLCKSFGALRVANEINFRLEPGARHALIGPNGAGKTTLVNMLSGVLRPSAGRVLFAGQDVTQMDQASRVKLGIGRTFQINNLFKHISVLDNVALAVAERRGVGNLMWSPAKDQHAVRDESMSLLASLGIENTWSTPLVGLPYGQQRLVEIGIALGLKPRVLLLDEPAAGVPKSEAERILGELDRLPKDIAIIIIEHDMDLVFRFAKRITVLVGGEVLVEGSPQEIAGDKRVHQVYIGEQAHA